MHKSFLTIFFAYLALLPHSSTPLSLSYQSCSFSLSPPIPSPCTPTLSLSLLINSSLLSPSLSVDTIDGHISLPTSLIIFDEYNRQWALSASLSIRFSDSNRRLSYPLAFEQILQNSYEVVEALSHPCPFGGLCCVTTNVTRSMRQNSTFYGVYGIGDGFVSSLSTLEVSQESLSWIASLSLPPNFTFPSPSLSPSPSSSTSPSPSPSPYPSPSPTFLETLSFSLSPLSPLTIPLLNSSSAVFQEGADSFPFIVLDEFFYDPENPSPNRIGMSYGSYVIFASCDSPLGSIFVVDSGDPYDQFSSFRNVTFSDLSGCSSLPLSSSSSSSFSLLLSLSCPLLPPSDGGDFLSLSFSLSSSSLSLRPLFPLLALSQWGGYLPGTYADLVVIYVRVRNGILRNGSEWIGSGGRVSAHIGNCCVTLNGSIVCEDIPLEGEESRWINLKQTVTFSFPFLSGMNATDMEGMEVECDVLFGSQDLIVASHRLSFNISFNSSDPFYAPVTSEGSCDPSSQLFVSDGTPGCLKTCGEDEVLDLIRLTCVPINCTVAYHGQRDYFDFNAGKCVPIVVCSPNMTYFRGNNTCILSPPPPSPSPSPLSSNLDCGSHGTPDPIGSMCICDAGWASPQTQSYPFAWCSVDHTSSGYQMSDSTAIFAIKGSAIALALLFGYISLFSVFVFRKLRRKSMKERRRKRREMDDPSQSHRYFDRSQPPNRDDGSSHSPSSPPTSPPSNGRVHSEEEDVFSIENLMCSQLSDPNVPLLSDESASLERGRGAIGRPRNLTITHILNRKSTMGR